LAGWLTNQNTDRKHVTQLTNHRRTGQFSVSGPYENIKAQPLLLQTSVPHTAKRQREKTMKTIKLSEVTQLLVGKSNKFNTVQIELNKKKEDGKIRKAFMSPKSCKAFINMRDEIKSVAAVLKQKDISNGPRAVELAIDNKKMLTVRKWSDDAPIAIVLETLKDGAIQPQLAFNLTEEEWTMMAEGEKDQILNEISTQTNAVYAEPD